MIYISAQPDQIYFIWQLEMLLRNLTSLGVTKDQIHVLVSYDPKKGLKQPFQLFIKDNDAYARFYAYPDYRKDPKYISSIRPHILRQHFLTYPGLSQETLFYHDSDILFSRIPQIEHVEANDVCYVSDTRNYLDLDCIRRSASEKLLDDMLAVVGLSKEKIQQEDNQTGGAQYILKGITAEFWEKVEIDSEDLYVLMKQYNQDLWKQSYPKTKEFKSKKRGIQAWCADMWAVLWNLWLMDKKVEIHSEMDFSWPYSPIEDWNRKAIQHYSGNIKEKKTFFKKSEFLNFKPWHDDALDSIPNTNCSYKIVEQIRKRKAELENDRPKFSTFAIEIKIDYLDEKQHELFQIVKRYYQKYIDIDIYFVDNSLSTQSNEDTRGKYKRIITMPSGYIIDCEVLQCILNAVESNNSIAFSFDQVFILDQLFLATFSKVLDIELLHVNQNKFNYLENPTFQVELLSKPYSILNNTIKPSCKGTFPVAYHMTYNSDKL